MMGSAVAVAALAVSLSSTTASYSAVAASGTTMTTKTISATISGGVGPYVSSWAVTTNDGITATSPTTPSTAFRKTNTISGTAYSATAILTVTDSLGATVSSSKVTITITNKTAAGTATSTAKVAIADRLVYKGGGGVGTVTASINYNSTGITTNHAGVTLETWLVSGVNSDYQIRATFQSGDAVTGTFGTWQLLSTNRQWSIAATTPANNLGTFLIEIRLAASPNTVLDSATITLNADNTP